MKKYLFYTKETQLQNQVLEFLKLKGIFCYRQNSGAFKTNKGFYRCANINGLPDVIAIINGLFVGFEIKINKNKLTDSQINTHQKIKKAGGVVFVIRNLEDLQKALNNILEGLKCQ